MDNEQLKDIIIDDCEDLDTLESMNPETDPGEILESVPAPAETPETVILTPEQLAGDEELTPEKKKLAAALAAAKELGIIEDKEPETATTLANNSDKIVEDLRQDYKVGTGQITAEEAYENGLEREAARFTGNVGKMLDRMVETLGHATHATIRVWADKAFEWVEEQWPEARALRPAMEKVVEVLDYKVVPAIVEGARKIATKVKTAVEKTVEKVKTTAKQVADKISSFFNGLF